MLRISQDISEKILGIVPRKFPGIGSQELFSGNSREFPLIWSTFSKGILQRNSSVLVERNSSDKVMRNSSEWVMRNSLEWVT